MEADPNPKADTVIITGVNRGIGYHLTLRFLDAGYRVIGVSRSEPQIDHGSFRHIKLDIGSLEAVRAVAADIPLTSLVGLINNAGVNGPIGPFEDNDISSWVESFQVNLFGAAALSQLCIPSLRANNGFIIFLSGGGSAYARPNFSAYSLAKTAVVRLAETLAQELYPDVYVYCMAPGSNRTQLQREAEKGGQVFTESEMVSFELPEQLSLFLARNRDPRYSGKFIHVRDNYEGWGEQDLEEEMYKLRRTTPF